MKEYKIKGLVAILAVALVLGLATSVFAAGKLSFGVKGGMGFMAPLKAGGNFLGEDYNDIVDALNQNLEDYKDDVEDVGGTVTINLAEKITRAWNVEGYAQYRITEKLGLRGSLGYLMGMTSDYGYDASYDGVTEDFTVNVGTSCLFVSLEPVLTLPMGNLLLALGGGVGYYMGKTPYSAGQEAIIAGVTFWDFTTDGTLSGSGIGFRGFLEGKYSTGSLTIGAELGYRSTGEIDTTGEMTTTGEIFGVPVDETEEVTGKLDFSGLYILFGIGFAV